MRLTVFGASGRTGRLLAERAVDDGHDVVAYTRSPHKLNLEHERLTVVTGDLSQAERIEQAIAGSEAVISVAGPTSNEADLEISTGTGHIIESMKKHGVNRLIVTAGAGVGDPQDKPGLLHRLIGAALRLLSGNVYEDMLRTVLQVRESGLDWTVIRLPFPTDGPAKGDVRVDYIGGSVGGRVTREDVAQFILQEAQANAYLHQAPVISN